MHTKKDSPRAAFLALWGFGVEGIRSVPSVSAFYEGTLVFLFPAKGFPVVLVIGCSMNYSYTLNS